MLDSETKRRIDTCRDILVGKVPDPKSQVEQITIALIYKFMDDMDAEAERLGGGRDFFKDEFAKYGWSKLMAPNMGGFDMLSLYSEAVQKMNQNPGVPPLFRDIFKNAFLPYRDPETLRSFLKEINGFTYDHSERLGDAFEYLLSVLGSQGEAGQFRTPRHIIDFMVEIIDPKKNEIILDPACGTAGFLISSYKHILKHNTKGYQAQQDREAYDEKDVAMEDLTLDSPLRYRGDLLTPDDRKRLATNIRGYDISPDMVRLSLVNMYLHGFTDPHIDEYDTLTSDERWNELADVILANPPFMSPKGGIKPHKRFSVQAKRSEVLFTDYIAEHLTPTGRAAMVVPEGIIFQSATAYKQLREMLVKDYLVTVISLPAGVFNPYSGVKTSILVMDKRLAKKTDAILFVKIDNDGFNLGAQRRPIDKNDLPAAARNIRSWLENVRNGVEFDVDRIANQSLVAKEKIGENGEWNLSSERYRGDDAMHTAYEMIELGDSTVFQIESGGTPKSTEETYWNGGIAWATLVDLPQSDHISQITKTERTISEAGLANSSAKILPAGAVIMSSRATIGRVGIARIPLATNQGFKNIVIKDSTKAMPEFVAYMMKRLAPDMEAMATGGTFKEISKSTVSTLKIPLPPLEVQKEIVAEIEGYQKIIDGARQVVENYQPRIPIDPDWRTEKIGELVSINNGYVLTEFSSSGAIACIKVSDMNLEENQVEIVTTTHWIESTDKNLLPVESVVFPKRGAAIATNKKRITRIPCLIDNNCMGLTAKDKSILEPRFLFNFLVQFDLSSISNSAGIALINNGDISNVDIPLPDIDTQRIIVAQIEIERSLVNANKELINCFEDKIKTAINRVWGEAE